MAKTLSEEMAEASPALWVAPAFRAWFESRPPAVQRAVVQRPGDRPYRLLPNTMFPVWIHSYGEHKDGSVTLTVDVDSWLLPRSVFGVRVEDLVPWEGAYPERPTVVESGGWVDAQ